MWGQYLLLQGHGKRKRKFFFTVLLPHSQPGASPSHLAGCFGPRGKSRRSCSDGVGWSGEREGGRLMVSSKVAGDPYHSRGEEKRKALSRGWILGEDLLPPPPLLILPCTAQQPSVLFLPGLLPQPPQPFFRFLQPLGSPQSP